MSEAPTNFHGTAIVVGKTGVLIRGRSRSGKSALALSTLRRAELLGLSARLVADDQVLLSLQEGRVLATAPSTIAGRIEISGVGIVTEDWTGTATIGFVVELREPAEFERMPIEERVVILGVALRRIVLPAREAAFGADVLHTLAMR
ncbi:HPr kinase [Aureimonas endophytica]|uniref:HPr kinase n=1 Tax=Aureimonas endophytica TaxID=2027858 RepID=A0A916ZX14_9HYPH|nr:hypothetical protein [Aureimonas endophytica]GGE15570.1 HPr kinase [Aureimonas endophytica]